MKARLGAGPMSYFMKEKKDEILEMMCQLACGKPQKNYKRL